MPSKSELQAAAIRAAYGAGINPDYFVNQINQESGFNPQAYNAGSDASGIAQIVPKWHPNVDVWDPYASLDYAARLVAANTHEYGSITKALIAYNWGPGNMLNNWDGTFSDLPRETRNYLDIIVGRAKALEDLGGAVAPVSQEVQIGPVVPTDVVKQTDDWSCSVRASYAALWAIAQVKGEQPPLYAWWQQQMVPRYADSNVGLKDGCGCGLANVLSISGANAECWCTVSIEEVQAWVRSGKLVLIGGRSWGASGHWALVRGVEADGTLMLANPSPGYRLGGTPITDQLLTSWVKSFWSAVVIEVPQAQATPVVPPLPPMLTPCEDKDVQIRLLKEDKAALESTLTLLQKDLDSARNLVGNAYNEDGQIIPALSAIQGFLRSNRS